MTDVPDDGLIELAAARAALAVRAGLFALVAAVASGLALLLLPRPEGTAGSVLLAALIAAPPLAALAARVSPAGALATLALLVLALGHPGLVLWDARGADGLASEGAGLLRLWPLIVLAIAAARSADALAALGAIRPDDGPRARWRLDRGEGERAARVPAAIAIHAVAAALLAVSIAATLGEAFGTPEPLRLMTATPVHLAIVLCAGAVAALVLAALVAPSLADAPPGPAAWTSAARHDEAAQRRLARTLIGLLPVLGFLGTVLGITAALATLPGAVGGEGADPAALTGSLAGIAVAFETTLLGLVASAVATLALALVERREAGAEADALARTRP